MSRSAFVGSAIAALVMAFAAPTRAAGRVHAQPALIPAPASVVVRRGSLQLRDDAVLVVEGGAEALPVARQFAERVEKIGGPSLRVIGAGDPGTSGASVHIALDDGAVVTAPEGYSLEIDSNRARLVA